MMTFSPIRLREIRDAIVARSGCRNIGNSAYAFGPLRPPFNGFFAIVPINAAIEASTFGAELKAQGYLYTQHLSLESFKAAGIPTEGLPACGAFIGAPSAQTD